MRSSKLISLSRVVATLSALACDRATPADARVASTMPAIETLTDFDGHQLDARRSPDGRRLAFSWSKPGEPWQIYLLSLGASTPRQITHGQSSSRGPTWSRDGARLAFTRDHALWTVAVDSVGAQPTRIEGSEDICCKAWASIADWSPTDDSITYVAGDSTETWISVIAASGGVPRRVTTHRHGEWFPRWSPNGKRIAFYSTWDGEMTDIWTVARDGTDLRRLTSDPAEDFRPAYSPDGEWVAFTSRRGGKNDIWAVPVEGGAAVRLTDADGIVLHVDWGRDGRMIFGYYGSHSHLWAVDVTTGTARQITDGRTDEDEPAFSPDGRLLAFVTNRHSPEKGVALMDWPNGAIRAFAAGRGQYNDPAWSPDGTELAFSFNTGGYADSRQIWVKPLAGDAARQLTVLGDARSPMWSADGSRIHFRAWGKQWSVSRNGGNVNELAAVDTVKLQPGAFDARRSPDGRMTAYLLAAEGTVDLYISSADGRDVRRLTTRRGVSAPPAWTADGKSVVVALDPGWWRLAAVGAQLPESLGAAGKTGER